MPFVDLPQRIYYREAGAGAPLVFLHSGWGHDLMPFDPQIPAFAASHRILIPHRTGYGASARVDRLGLHFHQQAADETAAFLAALDIRRAALWGHSDGAVIAAICALRYPELCRAVVLEAFHTNFGKPSNQAFFQTGWRDPEEFGPRAAAVLAAEHGADWREVIRRFSAAWIELGKHAAEPEEFFYGAPLKTLRVPALLLYGENDPRLEPGEIAHARRAVAGAQCCIVPGAGHTPHAEPAAAPEVSRVVREFLAAAPG
jgi:pimeloyl-ACP methyl ester carboxylesterase